ncbi:MAG: hypothetical protein KTR19_05305 [Hyphomicrobiales bacterium]|nr:hypothetical protein [Hyphomicrobiales bacterium]
MTTMSGFDYQNVDIYEEDSFGPPPRFLVEGIKVARVENPVSVENNRRDYTPIAWLTSLLRSLRR